MPKARRRLQPEQRREEVVQVAAEVFAEKGYRAANVTDIVTKASIGRGTFYLYFDSKQDVFLELIERYFAAFESLLFENQQRLGSAISDGRNVLDVWRGNIMAILEYHRDNPRLTSVIYKDALGSDEHFSTRVDELSGFARKHLRVDFQMLKRSGLTRDFDVDVVADMILGSAIYVIMERVVKRPGADLEALADEMIQYYILALCKPEIVKEVASWLQSRS